MRAIAILLLLAMPAHAADRRKIAALNVASTSLVTWAGCLVHAKLTNTMPLLIDAVKVYATVGEISDAFRDVFGTYQEPALF